MYIFKLYIILSLYGYLFLKNLTVFYLSTMEESRITILFQISTQRLFFLSLPFIIFHYNSISCICFSKQTDLCMYRIIYFSIFFNKFVGPDRAVLVGDLWVVTRGKILSQSLPLLCCKKICLAFFSFLCPHYQS